MARVSKSPISTSLWKAATKHTLTPEQFREMGRDYLSKLVKDYPNGAFTKQAEEELRALGAPAQKKPNPDSSDKSIKQRTTKALTIQLLKAYQSMSLLVVGSVAFDAVETPFGKCEKMLGGSASHFSISASFFTDVSIVGVVGGDFTRSDARCSRSTTSERTISRGSRKERHFAGPVVTNTI